MIVEDATISSRLKEFIFAPIQHPDILPSLLPLILGALVIELYFGRHSNEELGWNTSVGNSILWVATGLNLLLSGSIKSSLERNVSYFLVGIGVLVGYMDFFHKWSSTIAFRVSSADVVYPLAYVTAVIVKTRIPVNSVVLKAAAIFIVGTVITFRIIRLVEPSARDNFIQ